MLQALADTENGIILGIRLANRLGIRLDEEVTLLSLPSLLNRKLDESMHFRVIGAADFGFYGNDNTVMVDLQAAQTLFGLDESGQDVRLRLRVDDILNAGPIAANALQTLPDPTLAAGRASTSWSETQASLFDALRLEKTMTGFMLLMIVVIGAVNIVSTLVMVVADKSADIAILRTMGASRGTIMSIFVTQGTTAHHGRQPCHHHEHLCDPGDNRRSPGHGPGRLDGGVAGAESAAGAGLDRGGPERHAFAGRCLHDQLPARRAAGRGCGADLPQRPRREFSGDPLSSLSGHPHSARRSLEV
jgi:hypothetical protein